MLVLEAAVEQEQAMHNVTKTQLASLREDNQRLRHQLHAIRRHTIVNGEPATYVSSFLLHVALRVHCCRQAAHCASWEAKYRQQSIMYSSLHPTQSNQPKTKNVRLDPTRPNPTHVWTQPMFMSADIHMGWVRTWVG